MRTAGAPVGFARIVGWRRSRSATGHDRRYAARLDLCRVPRLFEHLLNTPHVGGCMAESMERSKGFLAEKLQEASFVVPGSRVGTPP